MIIKGRPYAHLHHFEGVLFSKTPFSYSKSTAGLTNQEDRAFLNCRFGRTVMLGLSLATEVVLHQPWIDLLRYFFLAL